LIKNIINYLNSNKMDIDLEELRELAAQDLEVDEDIDSPNKKQE
jgi:cytidylate kinase